MIHQRCLGDAWNWISQFFTLKFSVSGGLFYFLFFWICRFDMFMYSHKRTLEDFSSVLLKIGRVKVIFQPLRFHLSPFAAPRRDLASFSSDLKIVLDHQLVRQTYSWLTSHFWNVNACDEVHRTFPCSPDNASPAKPLTSLTRFMFFSWVFDVKDAVFVTKRCIFWGQTAQQCLLNCLHLSAAVKGHTTVIICDRLGL